jgi:uncharacterized protein (TIGR02271 family)
MTTDELRPGMRVRTADGAELGRIVRFTDDAVVLRRGFLFPRTFTLALDEVAECRGGEAWLAASRAELEIQADRGERDASDEGGSDGDRPGGVDGAGSESLRVPLVEEELVPEKRAREVGAVRIHKRVVTEHRRITVPVRREEVYVERVPASPQGDDEGPDVPPFEERTFSIPVFEEEIEVVKHPRIREEVRVTKVLREVERVAEGDVRRSEVAVEREGDVRTYGDDAEGHEGRH